MQSAQVMSPEELYVVHGEPVLISPCPPGATFLLCLAPDGAYGVFSVDTGCFVSRHETKDGAIKNAIALFEMKMPHPFFTPYWNAVCSLMDTYRLWMWFYAVARVHFPGNAHRFYPPWHSFYQYFGDDAS